VRRLHRTLLSLLTSVAAVGGLFLAPSSAAAAVIPQTTTTAWVHQCAAMWCGYHQIGPGTEVRVWCQVSNHEGAWTLITASSPWNVNVPIAGYVSSAAVNVSSPQSCANIPYGTPGVGQVTWLHSCPAMACGYGEAYQGDDIAALCETSWPFEGVRWTLLLDHTREGLAGFTHVDYSPTVPPMFC